MNEIIGSILAIIIMIIMIYYIIKNQNKEVSSIETKDWDSFIYQIDTKTLDYSKPFKVKVPIKNPNLVVKELNYSILKVVKYIKESDENIFTNHDNKKIWSYHYNLNSNHKLVPLANFNLTSSLTGHCEISYTGKSYQYLSHALSLEEKWPEALSRITPWAYKLLPGDVWFPPIIWLANKEGVTASPHYDMQDNFFIQLSGEKKFLIATPSLLSLFNPYPSLHPRWRQGQNRHYINLSSIENIIPISDKSNIYEITVQTGDLLYLPSFHIHAVSSGCGSTSMNIWVPSAGLRASDALQRRGVIPSLVSSSQNDLKSYANMLSENLKILSHFVLSILSEMYSNDQLGRLAFMKQLRLRYSQLVDTTSTPSDTRMPAIQCEDSYQLVMKEIFLNINAQECCTENELSSSTCSPTLFESDQSNINLCSTFSDAQRGDPNNNVMKSRVKSTIELLSGEREGMMVPLPIQNILLMDHFEELYEFTITSSLAPRTAEDKHLISLLSPCAILHFIDDCILNLNENFNA